MFFAFAVAKVRTFSKSAILLMKKFIFSGKIRKFAAVKLFNHD